MTSPDDGRDDPGKDDAPTGQRPAARRGRRLARDRRELRRRGPSWASTRRRTDAVPRRPSRRRARARGRSTEPSTPATSTRRPPTTTGPPRPGPTRTTSSRPSRRRSPAAPRPGGSPGSVCSAPRSLVLLAVVGSPDLPDLGRRWGWSRPSSAASCSWSRPWSGTTATAGAATTAPLCRVRPADRRPTSEEHPCT